MASKCYLFLLFLKLLGALADNCEDFKFKFQHPDLHDVCIPCTICPDNVKNADDYRVKLACKNKNNEPIPGQGLAWCTGTNYKHPQCHEWKVLHGKLKCRDNHTRSVYTNCRVICDEGYTIQNEGVVECMENLLWDKPFQNRPSCKRTDPPLKPKIESIGGTTVFSHGSDVTLKCLSTSETVGKIKFFFYKNQKKLPHDSKEDTYMIHGAKKKDHGGAYYCYVEDVIGKSEFSTKLFIDIKPAEPSHKESKLTVIVFVILLCFLLGILVFCLWKRCCRRGQGTSQQNYINSASSILTGSSRSTGQVIWDDTKDIMNTSSPAWRNNGLNVSSGSEICIVTFDGDSTTYKNTVQDALLQAEESTGKRAEDSTACRNTVQAALRQAEESTGQRAEDSTACRNTVQDPLLQAEESTGQRAEDSTACRNTVQDPLLQAEESTGQRAENSRACRNTLQDPLLVAEHGLAQAQERDASALCALCKDQNLMKKIIEHLDQEKDRNIDKPTFHDLGIHQKFSDDKIRHLNFKYRSDEHTGPTLIILDHMKAVGCGLSDLIGFLDQFTNGDTRALTGEIKRFQSSRNLV